MTQTQVLESGIELPKSFQPLQQLVDSACQQKDDSGFFQLLCENIMSLLQTFPLLGSLRARWQDEEGAFEKELR